MHAAGASLGASATPGQGVHAAGCLASGSTHLLEGCRLAVAAGFLLDCHQVLLALQLHPLVLVGDVLQAGGGEGCQHGGKHTVETGKEAKTLSVQLARSSSSSRRWCEYKGGRVAGGERKVCDAVRAS